MAAKAVHRCAQFEYREVAMLLSFFGQEKMSTW
jgi:hypothetical protein